MIMITVLLMSAGELITDISRVDDTDGFALKKSVLLSVKKHVSINIIEGGDDIRLGNGKVGRCLA